MSAPVAHTAPPGGGGHGARQQLDELDALLQRMLDLPVSRAEPEPEDEEPPVPVRPARPEPSPAPERWASSAPMSYPASYMVVETATPPFLEEPAPQPPDRARWQRQAASRVHEPSLPPSDPVPEPPPSDEAPATGGDWVPLRSSWQPSAQTWKPLAETWEQARTDPPQTWTPPPV